MASGEEVKKVVSRTANPARQHLTCLDENRLPHATGWRPRRASLLRVDQSSPTAPTHAWAPFSATPMCVRARPARMKRTLAFSALLVSPRRRQVTLALAPYPQINPPVSMVRRFPSSSRASLPRVRHLGRGPRQPAEAPVGERVAGRESLRERRLMSRRRCPKSARGAALGHVKLRPAREAPLGRLDKIRSHVCRERQRLGR